MDQKVGIILLVKTLAHVATMFTERKTLVASVSTWRH